MEKNEVNYMATLSEIAKRIVEDYNNNYNNLSISDIAKKNRFFNLFTNK